MRVLIVDDQAVVRRGTREVLADEISGIEFDEAENANDAMVLAGRLSYDLVILDIDIPGGRGIHTLETLQSAVSKTRVLVFSHHPEDRYAVRALRAGAAGYVTKDTPPTELVRAVKKALSGGKYVSAGLGEKLAAGLYADGDKPLHDVLSDRELEVLRLIGGGKTLKEIAATLGLSSKTVSTYRARILDKMCMTTNAELMRYALRNQLAD